MLQNGVHKVQKDFRDYDFIKSRRMAGFIPDTAGLPENFSVDANLWQPSQNAMGLPYGCTGMTQADLCSNMDGVLYDPYWIYDSTFPNDRTQGRELRQVLKFVCKNPLKRYLATGEGRPRKAFFSVNSSRNIDWFDAIRIAIWVNQHEKRAVSCATPWFPEWQNVDKTGILKPPSKYKWDQMGHNWSCPGWKTIYGQPYLIVKSWQGDQYGDNGFAYMDRKMANNVFGMWNSAAFTLADDDSVATVDKNVIDILVNFIRTLFKI